MDTESDDSERWEDFFGSSTDLTPSLIGLYDSLTGSLNTSHQYQQIPEEEDDDDDDRHLTHEDTSAPTPTSQPKIQFTLNAKQQAENNFQLTANTATSTLSNGLLSRSNCGGIYSSIPNTNKHRSFRVLSPNVQRIITQSGNNDNDNDNLLQNSLISSSTNSSQNLSDFNTKFINKPKPSATVGRQKLSHIPLSKNTCKLTQAGNELVETFESIIELNATTGEDDDDDDDYKCNKTHHHHHHQQQPIGTRNIPAGDCGIVEQFEDNDKTPTNNFNNNFNFETNKSIELLEIIRNACNLVKTESEMVKKSPKSSIAVVVDNDLNGGGSSNAGVATTSNQLEKNNAATNLCTDIINGIVKTGISDSGKEETDTKIQLKKKSNSLKSPLSTYARVKMLATSKSSTTTASATTQQQKLDNLSAESLDRLTDIKTNFSPKGNRKLSILMPDLGKSKHRPLSSSSISSTSSTSSSGSDHLTSSGKLGTSYLASVESLADQSENEHDPNSSLSVFERSCLEIIDSERSYVEDLRQIIQGYLLDWKERACLKLDEIAILFSNIQDIYEFNAILLQQLLNSEKDPILISQCFIDLKERFHVYTTYCTSYPEAISLLTSLLQASHTNALLTSTQKLLQHTLPLGSYLLKPVQRILKYHLLLDNLRKHCDFKEVVQAHEIMRDVARNIDQVKKKLEQQSRVKELSGILDGWLGPELTVLGELRLEGLLLENNKPRMIFLFETMLIITKPKEDSRLQFKTYIYRNNLMLREHLPGEPTSFNVIPYDEPRNQIKLTARNRDQKRLWAQYIKGVILEHFDIPNRAKELVYKLGDEEDRTPDKNSWKWSHNSPMPIYLERRNQYRRSEMRNRSKQKRKAVTNSTSFEGFNDNNNYKTNLVRQHSIDSNMISSLNNISRDSLYDEPTTTPTPNTPKICNHLELNKCNECDCNDKQQLYPIIDNSNKERSRSVPRISSFHGESDEDFSEINKRNRHSVMDKTKTSSVEIKMYNTKTIPKRIANLKKNRAKRETCKFYMDISEMDNTILKIVESSENLSETSENKTDLMGTNGPTDGGKMNNNTTEDVHQKPINDEKSPKDAEIISALIKESKDFDKILKKSVKKKSFDNSRMMSSTELLDKVDMMPPRPPSQSPPPLDTDEMLADRKLKLKSNEPIYETLLRNVHVPYKYSPILNRSKSQQYYRSTDNKTKLPPRPESDYVTLVYADSGDLQSIGSTVVSTLIAEETLRNSDSNINYENIKNNEIKKNSPTSSCSYEYFHHDPQHKIVTKIQKSFIHRLMSMKSENVSGSENSLLPRSMKNIENSFGKNTNKPPERRVSDVTEMCRQSFIHRQGSQAVGERMAHQDYADPKILFNSSVNSSVVSLNPQRDSVLSLTSSSDSITCSSGSQKKQPYETKNPEIQFVFTYEDNIENCLENDFRDSAVYSDDNNDRRPEHPDFYDYIKRPSSPPPPPPPTCQPPKLTTAPTIPQKPSMLPKKLNVNRIPSSQEYSTKQMPTEETAVSSAIINDKSNKSWVLQQIEIFNK